MRTTDLEDRKLRVRRDIRGTMISRGIRLWGFWHSNRSLVIWCSLNIVLNVAFLCLVKFPMQERQLVERCNGTDHTSQRYLLLLETSARIFAFACYTKLMSILFPTSARPNGRFQTTTFGSVEQLLSISSYFPFIRFELRFPEKVIQKRLK